MRALVGIALLGLALPVAAQQVNVASPAAERLRVTTTSEEASRHFFAGLTEARHFFTSKAVMHFDAAIAADQNLGLAHVVRAATVPGLSQAERTAEVNGTVAAMRGATTSEMLVALAIRDASNQQQSHTLWETAAKLMPGDPNIAFYAALTAPGNGDPEPMRAVTERFPDDAPSFNILAYQLWLRGDHDGGFKAVRRYMELAPDHPNAHDSYAELLQWSGRLTEAQALTRPNLIAQVHRDMAFFDAQLGRGMAVASHLAAAAQAGGADVPMQVEMTAAAHAVGGDITVARQATQKLATLAQPDNEYATHASVINAIIALRENKPKDALTQLAGAPLDDAWVRALTAECYVAAGNLADARALKNQVLNDPRLNFDDGYNISARIRAAKIKA